MHFTKKCEISKVTVVTCTAVLSNIIMHTAEQRISPVRGVRLLEKYILNTAIFEVFQVVSIYSILRCQEQEIISIFPTIAKKYGRSVSKVARGFPLGVPQGSISGPLLLFIIV